MGKLITVGLVGVFLCSCMATLTPRGAKIRVVTEQQKEKCEFLTVVTAGEMMGSSISGDVESAMRKIRNKVAEAGGNAMRIISVDNSFWGTTVVAEALRCDFARLKTESPEKVGDVHDIRTFLGDVIGGRWCRKCVAVK